MRFLALGVCALALISGSSNAQQVSRTELKGPTLQSAAVGFHVTEAKVNASTRVTSAPCCRNQGQDVAMMAVGVGAMIVGAIVGETPGTIIIIAGAGVALYGLYHYLE
ncbi:MAG TPA: hypothetical protein VFP26_05760 [Gemmatimonadaceae bacterium]|jgi:hypothetical protein|nr:hypothetical protein [Gemmatimonadaceae bacterium]